MILDHKHRISVLQKWTVVEQPLMADSTFPLSSAFSTYNRAWENFVFTFYRVLESMFQFRACQKCVCACVFVVHIHYSIIYECTQLTLHIKVNESWCKQSGVIPHFSTGQKFCWNKCWGMVNVDSNKREKLFDRFADHK